MSQSDLRLTKNLTIRAKTRAHLADQHRVRRLPGFYAGQSITYRPESVSDTIVEMHGHLAELDKKLLVPIKELTLVESDEQWRPVEGFEGRYLLSNHGKVVSTLYQRTSRERLLRLNLTGKHAVARLFMGAVQEDVMVGRLVALHFLPSPDPACKLVVPRDGNPFNLRWDNQLWLQAGEAGERVVNTHRAAGEKHPLARLSDEQVAQIRAAYAQGGTTHGKLADQYGVSRESITKLINNASRPAGGRGTNRPIKAEKTEASC